jgi:hypothetical protein
MTNEQTEAEKLAALDRAATQGVWGTDCADHDMPYENIVLKSGYRNIATVWIDDAPVPDYNHAQQANAALIVALVNAYRAKQVVLIGPDAVEKVARAMAELHLPGSKQLWKMYVPLATAALAALGVKP